MTEPVSVCRGCRVQKRSCIFGVVSLVRTGPLTAVAHLVCPSMFEGGPSVAHGGWTAAVFDDVCGRLVGAMAGGAVTATLSVDYIRPVPIQRDLQLFLEITSHEGRKWTIASSLRLMDSDADLARGSGLWIEPRADHFERHEAWLRDTGLSSVDAPRTEMVNLD